MNREIIKERREQLRFLQKDVAEMIGVKRGTYQLFESGKRNLHLNKLKLLADVLYIDISKII